MLKRFLCLCVLSLLLFSAASAEGIPMPQVGDTVIIGSYEQDNVTENGKEPLEWIVMAVKDDSAMLLSKYCIDTVVFHHARVPMYWGASDLRKWMNGDFFYETFTDEEQAIILTTTVENSNPHGMKGAGDDTLDRVYLLSKTEVTDFFPNQEDRVAYPTEYAKSKGCTLSPQTGSCRWWTRTAGTRKVDIAGIRLDGRITHYGMQDMDWPTNTIRPVMWVKCEK